jgi:hypothetical protein
VQRHLRACREFRRTGIASQEARIDIRRLFRLTNGLGGALTPVVLNDRFSPAFVARIKRSPRIYGAKFRPAAATS